MRAGEGGLMIVGEQHCQGYMIDGLFLASLCVYILAAFRRYAGSPKRNLGGRWEFVDI